MLKTTTLLVFVIAAQLLFAGFAFGQTRTMASGVNHLSAHHSRISRAQAFQVTAELKRQQQFLLGIATRYEAVSVYDFTPLLSYSYVWNAFRENRTRLFDPRRRISAPQAKLIAEGYAVLETDVLLSFLDHQLAVLNETLELNEMQYEEIYKALTDAINERQALLSAKGVDSKLFYRRIYRLSEQSEKRILSVLFPEQQRIFHKRMTLTKTRLVG